MTQHGMHYDNSSTSRRRCRKRALAAKRDDDDEDDPYANLLDNKPGLQDLDDLPVIVRRAKGSKGVPLDQQPFNELQNLKAAPLFGWAQKVKTSDAEASMMCSPPQPVGN